MDSGNNSGSLQSSSGGGGADEEYDSRAAVVVDSHASTNFINNTHHHHHHQPPFNHHMFDQNQINNHPLFFSASPQQHQLVNLYSWSKTLPSFSDHHLFPSSSQLPTATTMATTTTTTTTPPTGARNPKKRSRASRRAPTTVLTTDTSNFRAMVQEFTGIPAPPFTSTSASTSASPLFAKSFDLFGRPSSMTMMRSNNFDNLTQLPPYYHQLLRPKLQYSSLMDSSNLLTTMQNTISDNSSLNPKTTQNVVCSNGYGVIDHQLHTSLPDLVSSKGTATTTTPSEDQMAASGNYTIGKESSITDHLHSSSTGMKADHQGFIEPWICSSD